MLKISKLILAIILVLSTSLFADDSFQDQSIKHLLKVFSNPNTPGFVQPKNDDILGHYFQFLKMFNASEADRIAKVAVLGIKYYETKLTQAKTEQDQRHINHQIFNLLLNTKLYFEENPHSFNSAYFKRLYDKQYALMNPSAPTKELTEEEKLDLQIRKDIFRVVREYLKYLNQRIHKEIEWGDNSIVITARSYTPRAEERIEGNIVYIGEKLKEETVFTIAIKSADEFLEDIYTPAIEALLENPKTYGVVFESKQDIPYNLDLKNLHISKAGGTHLLIRKLPENGTCKQYFAP